LGHCKCELEWNGRSLLWGSSPSRFIKDLKKMIRNLN
jgi:hypothetical protein